MFDLEELVAENRFTIAVIFPFVGAVMFVASAEGLLPEYLAFNPLLILFGTLVMRLPLIAGMKPLMDRKAWIGLFLLTGYAYLIEYVGLETGFPYGEFEYLVELGPMIHGVPLGLTVFFIPLVANSYLLATLGGFDGWKRVPVLVGLVLLVDLVLDPASVSLGIWEYASGIFYGVPASNLAGWVLSGTVSALVFHLCLNHEKVRERLEETDFMLDDMVSFVLLWGFINLYYLNLIPVIIALGFALTLKRMERFDLAV
jgi:putative membrane protein